MTHDEIDDLATRFFAAVETADIDTIAKLYSEDATIWHNTDGVDQPRAENLRTLAWIGRHLPGRRYEDIRRIVVDDGFVQQHVLRATTERGAAFEMPAMMRVYCADGQVTRIEEYLDSAGVAALL